MLIDRLQAIRRAADSFRVHPAVAIVGPRQCGKSTLARMLAANEPEVAFFDLEKAVDRRRLQYPEQALSPFAGLVVIDEVQRQPSLFETLRVFLDRPRPDTRFLLLGSYLALDERISTLPISAIPKFLAGLMKDGR